jgi:hypothetical protein
MSLLKCKFIKNDSYVGFFITYQSAKLYDLDFTAKNGFHIISEKMPEIQQIDTLYLRGTSKDQDNRISVYKFESSKDADEFISEATEALNELKKSFVYNNNDEIEIEI